MSSFGNSGGAFRSFANKMGRIVTAPVDAARRKAERAASPSSIMSRMSEDIRGEVKEVKAKPHSLDQYFVIGKRFVAKKAVYVFSLVLIVLIAVFILFVKPWIVSTFFTRTYIINIVKF